MSTSPRSDLTDRTFGIIDPELHNDIAYHTARNWKIVVDCLIPKDSQVTCYSFPVPVWCEKAAEARSVLVESPK